MEAYGIPIQLYSQRFQYVIQRPGDASEHGGVAQSVLAGFGLAQVLDEVEEVADAVGLEGDNEFLVVEAKRVGGVNGDAGIGQSPADVFVHHALALFHWQGIPGARLDEWVDKEIFLIERGKNQPGIVRAASVFADIDRTLGHGKEATCFMQVWPDEAAQNAAAQALQVFDGVSSLPEHEVAVRAQAKEA